MKMFKSVIGIFLLLSTGSAIAAAEQGGHDGGGANLWQSSAKQVEEAIQWAFSEIRDDKAKWLFWATPYGPTFVPAEGEEPITVLLCLYHPTSCKGRKQLAKDLQEGNPIFIKPWDFLKLSPVEIMKDGPCPAPDKKHAAGSVSAFKIGAKLCLSMSELSRTVPSGLKAQVASVLAHEMAHLMGFDEALAEGVQKGVVENFPRINREDGYHLALVLEMSMASVESSIQRVIWDIRGDSADRYSAVFSMGEARGILSAVLDMLPDGLNNKSIPVKKPELYAPLKAGIQELKADLYNLASRQKELSGEELTQKLSELQKNAEAMSAMLKEFLDRSEY